MSELLSNEGQSSTTGLTWQEDVVWALFSNTALHVQSLGRNSRFGSWPVWISCLCLGVAGVGDGLRWGGGDPHIFITVAVTAARGFRAKATGEGVGG